MSSGSPPLRRVADCLSNRPFFAPFQTTSQQCTLPIFYRYIVTPWKQYNYVIFFTISQIVVNTYVDTTSSPPFPYGWCTKKNAKSWNAKGWRDGTQMNKDLFTNHCPARSCMKFREVCSMLAMLGWFHRLLVNIGYRRVRWKVKLRGEHEHFFHIIYAMNCLFPLCIVPL